MKLFQKIFTWSLTSLIIALSPAYAAEFNIQITSDKEVYFVDETAFFTVTVYKNGDLLSDESAIAEATFTDDEQRPATLTQISQGIFTYEAELTCSGQVTLIATLRHDFSGSIEAMEAKISRLEEEVLELEELLSGETNPKEQRILESKIDNRLEMIDKFKEKIANFTEPMAVAVKTVMVEPDCPAEEREIFADQAIYVGTASLGNTTDDFYINIESNPGWYFNVLDIYAGILPVPIDRRRNPDLLKFPFRYTFSIPIDTFNFMWDLNSLNADCADLLNVSVHFRMVQLDGTGNVIVSKEGWMYGENSFPRDTWGWWSVYEVCCE